MSQLTHEYLMKSSTDLSRVTTARLNSARRPKKIEYTFMDIYVLPYLPEPY